MNRRGVCLIVFVSTLFLIVAGATIGSILEDSGTLSEETLGPILGPRGVTAIKIVFFAMFCVLGLSIVPLLVRFFVVGQIRIGHGELFLIKWILAHEKEVIYALWLLCVIGLCTGLQAAIKDGFFIGE
jgi:hypothetical protein